MENVPSLAIRGRVEIRRVVNDADNATGPLRYFLSLVFTLGSPWLVHLMQKDLKRQGVDVFEIYIIVFVAAVLGAVVGGLLSNFILRRKIVRLGDPSYKG